jgi:hypothetical protein
MPAPGRIVDLRRGSTCEDDDDDDEAEEEVHLISSWDSVTTLNIPIAAKTEELNKHLELIDTALNEEEVM